MSSPTGTAPPCPSGMLSVRQVGAGGAAAPTTIQAALINAAIAVDAAIPLRFDAITRPPDRRAEPVISGFARKPGGDSPRRPDTISIIAGASHLHRYRLVSIQLDARRAGDTEETGISP